MKSTQNKNKAENGKIAQKTVATKVDKPLAASSNAKTASSIDTKPSNPEVKSILSSIKNQTTKSDSVVAVKIIVPSIPALSIDKEAQSPISMISPPNNNILEFNYNHLDFINGMIARNRQIANLTFDTLGLINHDIKDYVLHLTDIKSLTGWPVTSIELYKKIYSHRIELMNKITEAVLI